MPLGMVIARCKVCGRQYFAWTEPEARELFKKHRCAATLLDRELNEILDRVLHEDTGVNR